MTPDDNPKFVKFSDVSDIRYGVPILVCSVLAASLAIALDQMFGFGRAGLGLAIVIFGPICFVWMKRLGRKP